MNPMVPDFILEQHALGNCSSEIQCASIFADISGFTSLTETVMEHGREGAEILASALRFYFDPLVTTVHKAGGFITGFAGDAFTALFPQSEHHNAADYALWAGVRMQQFFKEHSCYESRFGQFAFDLKVGLSFGKVRWGIVEVSATRSVYYFYGPAIDGAAASEHHADNGEVCFDEALSGKLTQRRACKVAEGLWKAAADKVTLAPLQKDEPLERGERFIPARVAEMPLQGEFRNITSAFVSFDGVEDLAAFIQIVHSLSQRYGGTFTGLDFGDKGGNFLLHFGAPVSRENDPERASGFALELLSNLQEPVRLRAGLTTGLCYVGFNGGSKRREFACLGSTVNLAARLMMKAGWGEVWCTGQAASRLAKRYELEGRGNHSFKGFPEPFEVKRLGKRKQARPGVTQTRLYGREAELENLHRFLEPLFQGQFAGAMYIDGEAGMGKTVLAQRFRSQLVEQMGQEELWWLQVSSDQILRPSWGAFHSALFDSFQQSYGLGLRKENEARFHQGLTGLIEALPQGQERLRSELERLRWVLAALLGFRSKDSLYERLDPKLRHENTLQALSSWVVGLSFLRPVVLYLEDAHWLDGESAEAVVRLCRVAEHRPVALLLCSRPRDDGSLVRLSLPGFVPLAQMRLSGLAAPRLRELGQGILGGTISEALLTLLQKKSGSNPFYAEQVLLHLQERELLQRSSEGWTARFEGEDLLPRDVNSLLIARLDRLTREVKQTVQAASVLGQEFLVRTLCLMLRNEEGTRRRVLQAKEKQIWGPLSEMHYLFRHALLRDAAYEMQARARLRDLHRLAAEAGEELHQEDREEHLEELGYHWEKAGEKERARECYLGGARRAAGTYAQDAAERLYRSYLGLARSATGESIEARNELGSQVLRLQGRLEEARIEHEAALLEARELGIRSAEAESVRFLADLHHGQLALAVVKELYEQALGIHREIGNWQGEGHVLNALGVLHLGQGRLDEAQEFYEQALGIHRETGNRQGEGIVLGNLGVLHIRRGQLAVALEFYEQALDISREGGDRRTEGIILMNLGVLHKRQGRLEEARELYEQALGIHGQIGDRRAEGYVLGNLGILCHNQGRLEKALQFFERALAGQRETGDRRDEGKSLHCLGDIHYDQGRLEEARELYEQALLIHREFSERWNEGAILSKLGSLERLQTGNMEEGERLTLQGEVILGEIGDKLGLGRLLCRHGHLALGANQSAQDLLRQASKLAEEVQAEAESDLGKAVDRLGRAQAAFESGQTHRLFRGELIQDLTEGQRRWLFEKGHLSQKAVQKALSGAESD